MAVFICDPISGDDTEGAGTEQAPYKTIAKALAVASTAKPVGDTIVLNPGLYRETVTIAAGKNPFFYGRGICVIDGENIRALFEQTSSLNGDEACSYWQNVIFRNPGQSSAGAWYMTSKSAQGSGIHTGHYNFFNCTFYSDNNDEDSVIKLDNVYNFSAEFHHCTFKRLKRVADLSNLPASSGVYIRLDDCIVDVVSTSCFHNGGAGNVQPTNGTLVINRCAWPNGTGSGHVNITTTAAPYADATFPDPDLSLNYGGANIASYRGTGEKGSNIGSAFHPVFGTDMSAFQSTLNSLGKITTWRDPVSLVSWITDPNYPDAAGGVKGPALRVQDSNGDHWEVDTVTKPTSTSAAIISPVFKIPVKSGVTSKVRKFMWEADEDAAAGAGSNKVVDSSLGDATRTIQYRVSTTEYTQTSTDLAWTDANKTSDLSAVSATQDWYVQMRVVLTIAGQ